VLKVGDLWYLMFVPGRVHRVAITAVSRGEVHGRIKRATGFAFALFLLGAVIFVTSSFTSAI